MIEQHGHAAITSLECHFQRHKSMILFTKSCVDSSNVLPGSAVPLGFPDDITKNFSGLFDSAVLRVYKSEHALVDGRFRRGLHGLLKLLYGLLIFSIVSWAIIIAKAVSTKKAVRESAEFLRIFERSTRLDDLHASSAAFSGPSKNGRP